MAHLRQIRSFVRREGRITPRQESALNTLWERYGIDPGEGLLNFEDIFHRKSQVIFEIGFGNGDALFQMAKTKPECDFIGIEVYRSGVGALLANLAEADLNNVRVICEDAVEVLKQNVPDNSLDAIHIFFPDPWPKKRHHKRRLIQTAFCELLAKRLKVNGYLHLATDWENYALQMLEVVSALPVFYNQYGEGQFAPDPNDRPLTKFEKRGKNLGHQIWDLIVIKRGD